MPSTLLDVHPLAIRRGRGSKRLIAAPPSVDHTTLCNTGIACSRLLTSIRRMPNGSRNAIDAGLMGLRLLSEAGQYRPDLVGEHLDLAYHCATGESYSGPTAFDLWCDLLSWALMTGVSVEELCVPFGTEEGAALVCQGLAWRHGEDHGSWPAYAWDWLHANRIAPDRSRLTPPAP